MVLNARHSAPHLLLEQCSAAILKHQLVHYCLILNLFIWGLLKNWKFIFR